MRLRAKGGCIGSGSAKREYLQGQPSLERARPGDSLVLPSSFIRRQYMKMRDYQSDYLEDASCEERDRVLESNLTLRVTPLRFSFELITLSSSQRLMRSCCPNHSTVRPRSAAFPSSPLSRSALRGDTGLSAFSTKGQSSSVCDHSSNDSETSCITDKLGPKSVRAPSLSQTETKTRISPFAEGAFGSSFQPHQPDPDGDFVHDPMPEWEPLSEELNGLGVQETGSTLPLHRPSGLSNTAPTFVPQRSPKTTSRTQFSPSHSPRAGLNQLNSSSQQKRRFSGRQLSSPLTGSPRPTSDSPFQQGLSPSPSPSPSRSLMHSHSFLGSYEESLFAGRMASAPSAPLFFDAQLGVLGLGKCPANLKCPPHLNLKFPACFYGGSHGVTNVLRESSGTSASGSAISTGLEGGLGSPYVGTVDLEGHFWDQMLVAHSELARLSSTSGDDTGGNRLEENYRNSHHPLHTKGPVQSIHTTMIPTFPGYRIPPKGQIQLVIKNPNLTAVKLFLVPYDLTDMPSGTKTFIRQRCLSSPPTSDKDPNAKTSSDGSKSPNYRATKETLRYAIHLQFCAVAATSGVSKSRKEVERESETNEMGSRTTRRTRASLPDHTSKEVKNSPRIYLHRDIRVVFAPRVPDKEERLVIVSEMPGKPSVSHPVRGSLAAMGGLRSEDSVQGESFDQTQNKAVSGPSDGVYASYFGPGDDWTSARTEVKERLRAQETGKASRRRKRHEAVEWLDATSPQAVPTLNPPEEQEESQLQQGFFCSSVMANSDPNGERWESERLADENGKLAASSQDEFEVAKALTRKVPTRKEPQATVSPLQLIASSLPIDQQTAPKVQRQSFSLSPSASQTTSQGYFTSQLPQSSRPAEISALSASRIDAGTDQVLLDAWHHRFRNPNSRRSQSPLSRPLSPGGSRTSTESDSFSHLQVVNQGHLVSQVADRLLLKPRSSLPSSPSRSRGLSSVSRSDLSQVSRPASPMAFHQPLSVVISSGPNQPPILNSASSPPLSPHLLPISRSTRTRSPSLGAGALNTTTQVSDAVANGQILSEVVDDNPQVQSHQRPSLMRRISSQSSSGSLNSSLKDSVSSLKSLRLE